MQTIQIENDRLILSGDLGLTQVSAIWEKLKNHPALSTLALVDCRALSGVDSSAVSLLLNLQSISQNQLALLAPPAALKTLLGLYNVNALLPLAGESE